MNRALMTACWLTLSAALALILSLFYLYLLDGNPPAVLTVPYRTEQAAYAPGDPITLTAHVCKKRQFPVTAYVYLVKIPAHATTPPIDGKMFPLPPVASAGTPAGCGDYTISGFYSVPRDVPPGRYYLRGTNVFRVNFLTDRSLAWYTNEFDVTAPGVAPAAR